MCNIFFLLNKQKIYFNIYKRLLQTNIMSNKRGYTFKIRQSAEMIRKQRMEAMENMIDEAIGIDDNKSEENIPIVSERVDNIDIEQEERSFTIDEYMRMYNNDSDYDDEEKGDIKEKVMGGKVFYNRRKAVTYNRSQFVYKHGYTWFTADTIDNMCRIFNNHKTDKCKRYHEVCYDRIKLFADIDNYACTTQAIVSAFVTVLNIVFKELKVDYIVNPNNAQFHVDSMGKPSMHFIFNSGYVFKVNKYDIRDPRKNIHDSQYEFWQYVINYLNKKRKNIQLFNNLFYIKDNKEECCIDMAVYNNYHTMRTAFSRKDGDNTNRVFLPVKKINPEIKYYESNDLTPDMLINDPTCERYYDFGIFPEIDNDKYMQYDDTKTNDYKAIIEKHCTGLVVDTINERTLFMRRTEASSCPVSGKTHNHCGGYAHVYGDGIYYFCFSPRCQEQNADDKTYRRSNSGAQRLGVLVKHLTNRYTADAVTILNRPIADNNYKAKKQAAGHIKYEAKELYFDDCNRLINLVTVDYIDTETGEIVKDKSDSTKSVMSLESRNMWKQWLDQTIVFISDNSKSYFLVKSLKYHVITQATSTEWVRIEQQSVFSCQLPLGMLFDVHCKKPLMNVGDIVRYGFNKQLIKRFDKEYWIPYDIRRIPKVPYGYNTFAGFDGENNNQRRVKLMTDPSKKKGSSEHKRLLEKLADKIEYLNKENKELDDLDKMISGTAEGEERANNFINEERKDLLNSIDSIKRCIDDLNLELSTYDEHIENEEDNKRFEQSKMYALIRDICCNGNDRLFKWTLQYFAHLFQKPTEKPTCCLVFFGRQGSGKDSLCKWLSYLLGKNYYIMTGDIRRFTKAFNAPYSNKLLTCFNEVDSAKTKSIEEILKHLFDADEKIIEKKNIDARADIPCYSRFIINTNRRHAIRIENDDRRYVMYEWNNDKCRAGNVDRIFYNQLWSEIKDVNHQIDAFQYFKHMDISDFSLRDIPETKYKQQEREYNLDSVSQMLQRMYQIDTLDDNIGQKLKPHIKNLQDYMKISDEHKEEYNPSDWLFDYEFTINHIWDFYRSFCIDMGITSMTNKKGLLSKLNSFRIDDKVDKNTGIVTPVYLEAKSIKTTNDKYKSLAYPNGRLKGYRFKPEYLYEIVVNQLRLVDTKKNK